MVTESHWTVLWTNVRSLGIPWRTQTESGANGLNFSGRTRVDSTGLRSSQHTWLPLLSGSKAFLTSNRLRSCWSEPVRILRRVLKPQLADFTQSLGNQCVM